MALISKDVTNKHASVAFHVCLVLNQQHSGEVPKLQICVKQLKKQSAMCVHPARRHFVYVI
jgi:hypothetical protein